MNKRRTNILLFYNFGDVAKYGCVCDADGDGLFAAAEYETDVLRVGDKGVVPPAVVAMEQTYIAEEIAHSHNPHCCQARRQVLYPLYLLLGNIHRGTEQMYPYLFAANAHIPRCL